MITIGINFSWTCLTAWGFRFWNPVRVFRAIMWKLRKTHIVAIYYSQALRIYTLWLPMTCEWDSQATSDCSYHMCEFFLFYTFPSNELFFTFTQEKIVPDAKSGSLMGSQLCWCSGKALKAVKLALKDCKTSFSLFGLLFFLLPQQVFHYTAFAADGEIFFNHVEKNRQ